MRSAASSTPVASAGQPPSVVAPALAATASSVCARCSTTSAMLQPAAPDGDRHASSSSAARMRSSRSSSAARSSKTSMPPMMPVRAVPGARSGEAVTSVGPREPSERWRVPRRRAPDEPRSTPLQGCGCNQARPRRLPGCGARPDPAGAEGSPPVGHPCPPRPRGLHAEERPQVHAGLGADRAPVGGDVPSGRGLRPLQRPPHPPLVRQPAGRRVPPHARPGERPRPHDAPRARPRPARGGRVPDGGRRRPPRPPGAGRRRPGGRGQDERRQGRARHRAHRARRPDGRRGRRHPGHRGRAPSASIPSWPRRRS